MNEVTKAILRIIFGAISSLVSLAISEITDKSED